MRLRACQRLSRGSRATLHLFPWSQVTTVFRNNDLSGSITWELHFCFEAAFPKHQPSGQNVHKYTFESKEKVKISPTDTQRRKQQPQWHWTPAHHQNMRNVWNRPPVTLPLLPDGCGCWGTSVSASYTNIMKMPLSIIPSPGGAQVPHWLLQITQHSRRAALPFLDSPGSSGQAGPAEESSVKPLQSSHVLWGIWPMVFLPAFSSVSY